MKVLPANFRYLCPARDEIRQGTKNVVKVIVKFIEGERKTPQEQAVVGHGQVG
jgi:hypothetical protein